MSATVRSCIYLAAMMRSGPHNRFAIVAVEIVYVSLSAGIYAGMQQRALALRSRLLGNFLIAVGVPALAQCLDWFAHRALGAPAPARATVAVSLFTLLSALFHLHIMRRGVFLTGAAGHSLADDFRSMPRHMLAFLLWPWRTLSSIAERPAESEPAV